MNARTDDETIEVTPHAIGNGGAPPITMPADTGASKRRRITEVTAERTRLFDEVSDLHDLEIQQMRDQLKRLSDSNDEQRDQLERQGDLVNDLMETQQRLMAEIEELRERPLVHRRSSSTSIEGEGQEDEEWSGSPDDIELQTREQHLAAEVERLYKVEQNRDRQVGQLREKDRLLAQLQDQWQDLQAELDRVRQETSGAPAQATALQSEPLDNHLDTSRRSTHTSHREIAAPCAIDRDTSSQVTASQSQLSRSRSSASSASRFHQSNSLLKPPPTDSQNSVPLDVAGRSVKVALASALTADRTFTLHQTTALPPLAKTSVVTILEDARVTSGSRTLRSSVKCVDVAVRCSDAQWVREYVLKFACRRCYNNRSACMAVEADGTFVVLPLPPSLRPQEVHPGEDGFYIATSPGSTPFRKVKPKDGPWKLAKTKVYL